MSRFLRNPVVGVKPHEKKPGMVKVKIEDPDGLEQEIVMHPDRVHAHVDTGKTHFTVPVDISKWPKKGGAGGTRGGRKR